MAVGRGRYRPPDVGRDDPGAPPCLRHGSPPATRAVEDAGPYKTVQTCQFSRRGGYQPPAGDRRSPLHPPKGVIAGPAGDRRLWRKQGAQPVPQPPKSARRRVAEVRLAAARRAMRSDAAIRNPRPQCLPCQREGDRALRGGGIPLTHLHPPKGVIARSEATRQSVTLVPKKTSRRDRPTPVAVSLRYFAKNLLRFSAVYGKIVQS